MDVCTKFDLILKRNFFLKTTVPHPSKLRAKKIFTNFEGLNSMRPLIRIFLNWNEYVIDKKWSFQKNN